MHDVCMLMKEIIKGVLEASKIKKSKSSSPKLLVQFQINFTEIILGWTSNKVVQRMVIYQKTWPPAAGASFAYMAI